MPHSNDPVIVGSVLGAVMVFVLTGGIIFLVYRRYREKQGSFLGEYSSQNVVDSEK